MLSEFGFDLVALNQHNHLFQTWLAINLAGCARLEYIICPSMPACVPVQRILDTRADSFMETFRLVD